MVERILNSAVIIRCVYNNSTKKLFSDVGIIRLLQPLKNHVCGNCKPVPYINYTNGHNDLCNFMIGKKLFCLLIWEALILINSFRLLLKPV